MSGTISDSKHTKRGYVNITSSYVATCIWWTEGLEPYLYMIDAHPYYNPIEVQSKSPGGKTRHGQALEDAARDETRVETGLIIPPNALLILTYEHLGVDEHRPGGMHQKVGYRVHRDECYGSLRRGYLEEERSVISEPYKISLTAALECVYAPPWNPFHKCLLRALARELSKEGYNAPPVPCFK